MYEISRKHNVFIAHKEILSYYKYFVFTYFWTCKTTRRTINKTYYKLFHLAAQEISLFLHYRK